MKLLFDELFSYLLKNVNKEEILFAIFEYLNEHIPFEVILCASVNRKEKIFTSFVEYSLDSEILPSYSYALREVSSQDTFLKLIESRLGKISREKSEIF